MSSDRTDVLGGQSLCRRVKEKVWELCEFTGGWRGAAVSCRHTGGKDKETQAERLIDFSRIRDVLLWPQLCSCIDFSGGAEHKQYSDAPHSAGWRGQSAHADRVRMLRGYRACRKRKTSCCKRERLPALCTLIGEAH